jgi:tRNA (guanine-N7-)-methyltransferase
MNQKYNLKNLSTLLPYNIDWASIFNNDHPVDLEIGCGRPHFFFDRAFNFPTRNIVGIEWKYEFIEQASRRIARERIHNAKAFHGNAWLLLPLLFAKDALSQVFINFPDPWWKMRHKKRLVLNEVLLKALQERMCLQGYILLQTDVEELFLYYKELINNSGMFRHDEEFSEDRIVAATKAQTHREKKCLLANLPIYRGIFRKINDEKLDMTEI